MADAPEPNALARQTSSALGCPILEVRSGSDPINLEVDVSHRCRIGRADSSWTGSTPKMERKFMKGTDFDPSQNVLPGMYVPATYLKLGIDTGEFNTGPSDSSHGAVETARRRS